MSKQMRRISCLVRLPVLAAMFGAMISFEGCLTANDGHPPLAGTDASDLSTRIGGVVPAGRGGSPVANRGGAPAAQPRGAGAPSTGAGAPGTPASPAQPRGAGAPSTGAGAPGTPVSPAQPRAGSGANSSAKLTWDDDTVTDANTHLIWQRVLPDSYAPACSGKMSGSADSAAGTACTWEEAKAYCAGLTLGTDTWRAAHEGGAGINRRPEYQ